MSDCEREQYVAAAASLVYRQFLKLNTPERAKILAKEWGEKLLAERDQREKETRDATP